MFYDRNTKGLVYDDVRIIPRYSDVTSRSECSLDKAFLGKVLKTPILSSPMDTITGDKMVETLNKLGAAPCLHRFMPLEDQLKIADDNFNSNLIISLGVTGDYFERLEEFVHMTSHKRFLLDVAHGHHELVRRAIVKIKEYDSSIYIIAGNVATMEGASDLTYWGADAIRVGIGGGSCCATSIETGVGLPSITTIVECRKGTHLPIIADGGIRTPGDIAKALAAGADLVMIGSMLAGTDETPGELIDNKYKSYRGSASFDSKTARGEAGKHVEGESTHVPAKGPVKAIIERINDGLKSSLSYVGARDLKRFYEVSTLMEVSTASAVEAKPHILGR